MKPLPSPQSFAEGQRYIYGLLASAAGLFCGAASGLMVALLMWGGWSRAEEHTIVTIFGWSLGGFIVAMIVVIPPCWWPRRTREAEREPRRREH
jgi:hypothetical protein